MSKIFLFFSLIIAFVFIYCSFPKNTYAADSATRYWNFGLPEMSNELNLTEEAAKNGQNDVSKVPAIILDTKARIFSFIRELVCPADDKSCLPQLTVMGNISTAIASIYANPPASLVFYTSDFLANAGFIRPVHAQGIGFAAMSAFLNLWKVSRNIAYAALIIVMVAIGFMIIFRMKIDPKTVISLQAALPKIILTLVLITFSYPIVGFLIDIMYLSMAIVISLMVSGMGGSVGGANVANLQSTYMTASLLDLFGAVFWPLQAFGLTFIKEIGIAMGVAGGFYLGQAIILGPLAAIIGLSWPAGLGITAAPAGIFLLIIILGLLFTFIRLLLLLLNSWIQVIIAVIIGPIQLLAEAIPGKSAFTEWILNILANLVVFPATAAVIIFSTFLTIQGQTATQVLNPPFIGVLPGSSNIMGFLGIGVMFMAPTLVASIKKMFAPKPALPISPGTIMAPLTGSFQTAMGAASQFYYMGQLKTMA
ncbi:hypothetical protein MUP32_05340, partial [Candidatus Microgenomates bacterium]|nr:hypothetical protein [Candidatus Microgenomates bacterium]